MLLRKQLRKISTLRKEGSNHYKKIKTSQKLADLALSFGLPASRGLEAEVKAILAKAIVNGSLQKVTIDRLVRILSSIGLGLEVKIKKAG